MKDRLNAALAVAFFALIVAGIYSSRKKKDALEAPLSVAQSNRVLLEEKTTAQDSDEIGSQETSELVSSSQGTLATPSVSKPTHEERFPENYVEIFPGLDTYSWLFNRTSRVRQRMFHKKLMPSDDTYEHERLRLIDLERGGALHDWGTDGFREELYARVKAMRASKFFYENGREISSLDEQSEDLPICVINVDLKRVPERLINPKSNVDVNGALSQNGFIESVQHPIMDYPGYRGVRFTFSLNHGGGAYQWLRSIECLVKVTKENPDRYKKLELIHLIATIGVGYNYSDAKKILHAIGWKAFEEMFPGHPLNDR